MRFIHVEGGEQADIHRENLFDHAFLIVEESIRTTNMFPPWTLIRPRANNTQMQMWIANKESFQYFPNDVKTTRIAAGSNPTDYDLVWIAGNLAPPNIEIFHLGGIFHNISTRIMLPCICFDVSIFTNHAKG